MAIRDEGPGGTPFETITFEVDEAHVATLTINQPEAMNSFTRQMCEEFRHAWHIIAHDNAVHAVVVRAAPGRAFSTGMDVRKGENMLGHDNVWTQWDSGEDLGLKSNKCWKPVVTAVHGMCAGGAFYWVNESDIVICSPEATFFDPHVTYGMTASLEPIGLRWRIPLQEVLRMALLGNDERISAETALRISLVTEIVPLETLWHHAHELAAQIAAKPPVAVQGTFRAIWDSLDMTRRAGLHNALKYPQLGNPIGKAQVDRNDIMSRA